MITWREDVVEQPTATQWEAYKLSLADIQARIDHLDADIVRRMLQQLSDFEGRLTADLVGAEGWNAAYLGQLKRQVEQAVTNLSQQYATTLGQGQREGAELGAASIEEPLRRVGVELQAPVMNEALLQVAIQYAAPPLRAISDELRNKIGLAVTDAVFTGGNVQTLTKEIRRIIAGTEPIYPYVPRQGTLTQVQKRRAIAARAEAIARTELSRVTNLASDYQLEQAKEQIPDLESVFLTARDERVCPRCGPLHRKVFKIGDPKAPKPPLHTRCRCRYVAWRAAWGRPIPAMRERGYGPTSLKVLDLSDFEGQMVAAALDEVPSWHLGRVEVGTGAKGMFGDGKLWLPSGTFASQATLEAMVYGALGRWMATAFVSQQNSIFRTEWEQAVKAKPLGQGTASEQFALAYERYLTRPWALAADNRAAYLLMLAWVFTAKKKDRKTD